MPYTKLPRLLGVALFAIIYQSAIATPFISNGNENLPIVIGEILQDSNKVASPTGVAITPSTLRFNVEPGKSVTKKISINNVTKKKYTFNISFRDFNMDGKGDPVFLDEGEGEYSLSKWMTTSSRVVTVVPGAKKSISINLNVPNDEEGARAAWSMVFIEQVEERQSLDFAKEGNNTVAFGVVPTFAFAIYAYQNPPNLESSNVEVVGFDLISGSDEKYIQVDVENVGNGISYCSSYIEITHDATGTQKRLPAKSFNIIPGLVRELKFDVDPDLPKGKYSGVIVVDYGSENSINAYDMELEL